MTSKTLKKIEKNLVEGGNNGINEKSCFSGNVPFWLNRFYGLLKKKSIKVLYSQKYFLKQEK
jgi:hypothetical protein